MVHGSRYWRALESVSVESALSSALTIYPCQIRVHQRWQLQLLTARKKEWWPATADSLPLSAMIHTTLAVIEPTTFRLLVWRRATETTTLILSYCITELLSFVDVTALHMLLVGERVVNDVLIRSGRGCVTELKLIINGINAWDRFRETLCFPVESRM